MVNTFTIPDELGDKITPPVDVDPVKDHQSKVQQEKQQFNDLCNGVYNILDNPKVAEACKDGPLLIKEQPTKLNLYLGYAVDVYEHKILCFFNSYEKEKNSDERSCCLISKKLYDVNRLTDTFNISTDEELNNLVLSAISLKYQAANSKKTNGELKKTLK